MMGKSILKNVVAVLVIAAAVAVCYENSLDGAFVFDDSHYITENNHVKNLKFDSAGGFVEGLHNIVQYDPFRSLLTTTFALHYTMEPEACKRDATFVPDTASFHVVNIAIHFFNAVMVFFLVKTLAAWRRRGKEKWWAYFTALAAALLFSTAAVATEGVTYIVGRSNSLCTFFILAALLVFLRARRLQEREIDEDGRAKRKSVSWMLMLLPTIYLVYKLLGLAGVPSTYGLIAGAVLLVGWIFWVSYSLLINKGNLQTRPDLLMLAAWLLFIMAVFTKQLSAAFPLLALMLDGLVLSGGTRGYLRRRLKYHVATLGSLCVLGVLYIIIMASMPPERQTKEGREMDPAYLATQVSGPVMMGYFEQFLVPTNLNFDSPLPVMTPEEASRPGNILTPYLLALALIFAFTLWVMRRARLFAAGMFWYFICLVPSSSIIRLSDAMDEGRIYLPIIGLCWAVAAATAAAYRRCGPAILRPAIILPLIAIIVLNGVNTRQRNEVYASPSLLWQDTIAKSPDNSRAYEGLGYVFMNLNDTQRRIIHHSAKLRGVSKYLEDERLGLDEEIQAIHGDVKKRRQEALEMVLDEQRRNLNAALMLFRAIRDFGEGDIPLTAPDGGMPGQLYASKTHHNLNMGVVYAMRTSTLEKIYYLYGEIGSRSEKRSALRDQMLVTRFAALGILHEASRFTDPRQPKPLNNYASLCLAMSGYCRQEGLIAQYEYFANETQRAAFIMLAHNPVYYPAMPLLLRSSFGLAEFYSSIGHINKYRQLDCYEKIFWALLRMERASGRQPHPNKLAMVKDRIEKLKEEIGAGK